MSYNKLPSFIALIFSSVSCNCKCKDNKFIFADYLKYTIFGYIVRPIFGYNYLGPYLGILGVYLGGTYL